MTVAPSLRMWRTLVHVERVTHAYFDFTLPGSTWNSVFWLSRYALPWQVDEALDNGQEWLHVHANIGARHPTHVRFDFWEER